MQYFKGDATELKMYNSASNIMTILSSGLSDYFDNAYNGIELGEFLFDEKRIPLTNAIKREIFIDCFKEILEAWAFCGTFESYLTVFRKIFGEDATIEFTIPAVGRLQIDIETSGLVEYNFIAREIVNNAYVFYDIVDDVGDNIVFENFKGIETEAELEKILFQMVPNGIFTEVSLTIA
jgi:hypothetical protein